MGPHNHHFGETFTGALLSQHLRLDGAKRVLGDLEMAEWGCVGSTHWLPARDDIYMRAAADHGLEKYSARQDYSNLD